jgi:cytochrome P450/biotin carboxylase
MTSLIFVESNTTGTGMMALATARNLGFTPVLLTSRPGRYPGLASTGAVVAEHDTNSLARLREAVASLGPVAGITTTSEFYLVTAARLAAELGLPGNPPEAVAVCRHKPALRRLLPDPRVRYAVATDTTGVDEALARVGLPCVVKPADDTGSYGVRVCATAAEARAHAQAVLGLRVNVRGQPTAGAALIETYLDGPEYSVEMVGTPDGQVCAGITGKSVASGPHPVETGHIFPADLRAGARAEIEAAVRRALAAAGLHGGVTHTEVKYGPDGCSVVEVNARPAGGMIPELVRQATGVDLVATQLRWAAGLPAPVAPAVTAAAGIRFLTAGRDGIVTGIGGADAAAAVDGVLDVTVTAAPGDPVRRPASAYDRLGHVIAAGATRASVQRALDEASAVLRVSVGPATPVADFDSHDPALAADPFPAYERLRSSGCPVSWSGAWDGFWVASRHAEVAAVARDHDFKTADVLPDGTVQGISIPPPGHTGRMIPLELDTPACLKYRRLLSPLYSPSQVASRRGELRELAAGCVDAIAAGGRADLVDALTLRLPGIVTMRDIGLPDERWREMADMIHRGLLSSPHDMDTARDYAQLVCLEIIAELETCGDRGIIGMLRAAEIDGAPLSDADIVSIVYLLLLGMDPASTLTATALWHLARHPDMKERLIADPSLIPRAAEEYLRWVSPIQGTGRIARRDVVLGGADLRAGDRLFVSWASANRDALVFGEADRVDLDRDTSRHVAFGGGVHYCLGASLVRAMFTVMIEEILTRIPGYTLADEAAVEWFPDVSFAYGVSALPVTFPPERPGLPDEET